MLAADGTRIRSWQAGPSSVAVDADGNVYITENESDGKWSRVRVLAAAGNELARWAATAEPGSGPEEYRGIAVDRANRVYVVNWPKCRVEVFSSRGAPLGRFGSCGSGDRQFGLMVAIAVSASGKVYISDSTYNRVQIFQVQ